MSEATKTASGRGVLRGGLRHDGLRYSAPCVGAAADGYVVVRREFAQRFPAGAFGGGYEHWVMRRAFEREAGARPEAARFDAPAGVDVRGFLQTVYAKDLHLQRAARVRRHAFGDEFVEDDPSAAGQDQAVRRDAFAQAGRPGEQHVVERLAALQCRRHKHAQVVFDFLLTDELVERLRPQHFFVILFSPVQARRQRVGSGFHFHDDQVWCRR